MKTVMRQAYSEVNEILKYMPEDKVNKIPSKYMYLFEKCGLPDYQPNIDPNKPISEQKIVHETLVILTMLKYNYWCTSDKERRQMEENMRETERKHADKYDISKLNNKSEKQNNIINLPAKVEKQSWFSKIIAKIKNIFKH